MSERRTLAIASYPTPESFSGEAAQYEMSLLRLPRLLPPGWRAERVEVTANGPERGAAALDAAAPEAVLFHIRRPQTPDALALARAFCARRPDLPLILCGWPAHPPYVSAVAEAAGGLPERGRLALACGEVEAIVPEALGRLDALEGAPGVALWDASGRAWRGARDYAFVEDLDSLPEHDDVPAERAGWIELARGCRYRCAFCMTGAFKRPRLRRFSPERVGRAARAAAERGAVALELLSASNSFDLSQLRALGAALRGLGPYAPEVGGPVHPRHVTAEVFEAMSVLRWSMIIVGLQTLTPAAQKLMRRADDPDQFARAMERLAALVEPSVEIILGLPGDTAVGFRRTVEFLRGLPVRITVHTLRLDPWSSFLLERERLGLTADFARCGRVTSTPTMAASDLEACRAWLRGLADAPLTLDGEPLDDRRPL